MVGIGVVLAAGVLGVTSPAFAAQSPFEQAVVLGDTANARAQLDAGADVRETFSNGFTPLYWAMIHGNAALARLLLERGAPVDGKNAQGQTPLHTAAMLGHVELARMLLAKGAAPAAGDGNGITPFFFAVSGGKDRVEMVRLLLDAGVSATADVSAGLSPLPYAVETGQAGVVRLLLERGAEIRPKENAALVAAAMAGRRAEVESRCKQGADPDKGYPLPLACAAAIGRADIIKTLLGHRADVDGRPTKQAASALQIAAASGSTAAVAALLDGGADIEQKNVLGGTPLIVAAGRGHATVVQLLLDRGAKRDAATGEAYGGRTAWDEAVSEDRPEVLAVLFQPGMDLNRKNKWGTPLLNQSLSTGNGAAAMFLIDRGADASASGGELLACAARTNRADLVKLVLDRKLAYAEYEATAALSSAENRGATDAARALREAGAKAPPPPVATAPGPTPEPEKTPVPPRTPEPPARSEEKPKLWGLEASYALVNSWDVEALGDWVAKIYDDLASNNGFGGAVQTPSLQQLSKFYQVRLYLYEKKHPWIGVGFSWVFGIDRALWAKSAFYQGVVELAMDLKNMNTISLFFKSPAGRGRSELVAELSLMSASLEGFLKYSDSQDNIKSGGEIPIYADTLFGGVAASVGLDYYVTASRSMAVTTKAGMRFMSMDLDVNTTDKTYLKTLGEFPEVDLSGMFVTAGLLFRF